MRFALHNAFLQDSLDAKGFAIDNLKFTPEGYGAIGNGTANDTAAVQSAINDAIALGATLTLSAFYKVSHITSSAGLKIEGNGQVSSGFIASAATGNVLSFAPLATPDVASEGITGLVLRDFSIQSSVQRTSGAAVYARYSTAPLIENISIGAAGGALDPTLAPLIFDGIVLDGTGNPTVLGCFIYMIGDGIRVNALANGSGIFGGIFAYDGFIGGGTEIWSRNNYPVGSCGIRYAGGHGGLRIDDTNISFTEHGILVDRTAYDINNRELTLGSGVYIDDTRDIGIWIRANSLTSLRWHGAHVAAAGRGGGTNKSGLQVDTPNLITGEISGGVCYYNVGSGMKFMAGQWDITGLHCRNNGDPAYGGSGHGIETGGSDVVVNLSGGRSTSNNGYGIFLGGGTLSFNCTGTNLGGNVSGPVNGTPWSYDGTPYFNWCNNAEVGFRSSNEAFNKKVEIYNGDNSSGQRRARFAVVSNGQIRLEHVSDDGTSELDFIGFSLGTGGQLGLGVDAVGKLDVALADWTPATIGAWTSKFALFGAGGAAGSGLGISVSNAAAAVYLNFLKPAVAYLKASFTADNYEFRTLVGGVTYKGWKILNSGALECIDMTSIGDFADDAAAAAGSVAIGQVYRTGSALQIRVT